MHQRVIICSGKDCDITREPMMPDDNREHWRAFQWYWITHWHSQHLCCELTHCVPVIWRYGFWSSLVQIMVYCLKSSSFYMNASWSFIHEALGNSTDDYFTGMEILNIYIYIYIYISFILFGDCWFKLQPCLLGANELMEYIWVMFDWYKYIMQFDPMFWIQSRILHDKSVLVYWSGYPTANCCVQATQT